MRDTRLPRTRTLCLSIVCSSLLLPRTTPAFRRRRRPGRTFHQFTCPRRPRIGDASSESSRPRKTPGTVHTSPCPHRARFDRRAPRVPPGVPRRSCQPSRGSPTHPLSVARHAIGPARRILKRRIQSARARVERPFQCLSNIRYAGTKRRFRRARDFQRIVFRNVRSGEITGPARTRPAQSAPAPGGDPSPLAPAPGSRRSAASP